MATSTKVRGPKKIRSSTRLRSGTVTTEMAICLPLLFMVFLGSIDLIRYNLLRNIVTQATYEGARTGIVKGATIAEVEAKVEEELSRFTGPLDYTLVTTPESLSSSGSDTLTLTLTCDIRAAGWILSGYITGDTLVESATVALD